MPAILGGEALLLAHGLHRPSHIDAWRQEHEDGRPRSRILRRKRGVKPLSPMRRHADTLSRGTSAGTSRASH